MPQGFAEPSDWFSITLEVKNEIIKKIDPSKQQNVYTSRESNTNLLLGTLGKLGRQES